MRPLAHTPDEVYTWPQNTLLANSLRCVGEFLKSRNVRRSERLTIKQGDQANKIERSCDAQPGQTALARSDARVFDPIDFTVY